MKKPYILITGPPGCGKTTLISKIVTILKNKNVLFDGFYTTEIRSNGIRCGFEIVLLNSDLKYPLASLPKNSSPADGPRVGRYVVDVESFENAIKPIFQNLGKTKLYIIDEIGKMELFSSHFKISLRKLFSQESGTIILATVPVKRPPFVEELCKLSNVNLITVNNSNRNNLADQISEMLCELYEAQK